MLLAIVAAAIWKVISLLAGWAIVTDGREYNKIIDSYCKYSEK